MNLATIAWKSIRQRALASSLTTLSVALGVMLMVAVLVINSVVTKMFNQSATGFQLVVGAKGSPLQLVLNTIYHIGVPIENVPYTYYLKLKKDPRVAQAIPFASGDTTQEGGFRIIGTDPEFFEIPYIPGRQFRVKGRFPVRHFDAVIGSQVARQNNWNIGQEFAPVHGGNDDHVHEEKFTVRGILAPTGTPNDKVVFIHLEGFYKIAGHEKPEDEARARAAAFAEAAGLPAPAAPPPKKETHEEHAGHHHHHHELTDEQKEVTAILLNARYPTVLPTLQAQINEGPYAQATNPLRQIMTLMNDVVGSVRTMLLVMTALIIVVSGVGIFVSIYNSMSDRRREIAIMRALGARRTTVFSIILAESIALCVAGGLLGLALGHGLVFVAAPIVEMRSGVIVNPFAFEPIELTLFPALIALAALIGVIPGMTAYRTDVARTLAS